MTVSVVVTWFGMNTMATSMEPASHNHGAGTGTDEAPADQAPAHQEPAPTEEQGVPSEPGHDDAHSH